MAKKDQSVKQLFEENQALRARLEELEDTLRAIQRGEVDALVISDPQGEQVYTLKGANQPYRVLVETMNEGTATVAPDGIVLYSNNRLSSMLKMPLEQVIGTSMRLHITEGDRSIFDDLLKNGLQTACQGELSLKAGEGTLPVQLSLSPVRSEGMDCAVMVLTDLTEQKRAEEALRRASENLEVQVRERTAQLQESEARYRSIVELSPDAIVIHSEGRYVFVNPSAVRLFGAEDPNEIIGKWVLDLVHPDFRDMVMERMTYIEERKDRTPVAEAKVLRLDGSEVDIEAVAAPILYMGKPATQVILRDITERKKADMEKQLLLNEIQAEKDKLSALVNSIPDEIWFADVQQNFTLANPAALHEFGYDTANNIDIEALARNLEVYRPDGTPRPVEETPPLRALKGEVVKNLEEIVRTPASGELRNRQVNASPVRDRRGNIIGSVSVVRDITELRRAEEELKKLTEELKRSNRDLEQFAHIASHDLQSPLRTVEGFAKMLAKKYKGKLDDKADEFISYISNGVKDMQILIKDVLEYSKVGSGKKFKKVDTSLCVARALANLRAEIDEKRAVITQDDPLPTVLGDSIQMTSVFQNLIANAIKFNKETPIINISVREDNKEYIFSVQDNGIGIDAEYIDKIFNIFQRLHNRYEYSGTGIGLAMCKKIVEHHGGRIWVESEPDKGTTFYFTIPAL